jgi:hypothetical protein
MPVVGTTAYNTAGQITALVRSLLNDAAGNLFTDTVLLPYVNSAYRKAIEINSKQNYPLTLRAP